MIETLNLILALGGVGLIVGGVILLIDQRTSCSLNKYVERWGFLFAFFLTLLGSALTLVYSEVFGFIPCGLCWLQRVFLYPQVFMLGTDLYFKKTHAILYGIVLSVPGLVVSLYQHYLQMGGSELVGCPKTGAGADCSERILFEFGFMTFPLMSAGLFFFLIMLYLYLCKLETISSVR